MSDLIKRLRAKKQKGNRFDSLEYEAADRIEELVKEKMALNHLCNAIFNRHIKEITAAEAKLAKAVAGINRAADQLDWCQAAREISKELDATLAELEKP